MEPALYSAVTCRQNPPHRIANIVGDEKVAAFIESKPNWQTARFFVRAEETGHDILGGAGLDAHPQTPHTRLCSHSDEACSSCLVRRRTGRRDRTRAERFPS